MSHPGTELEKTGNAQPDDSCIYTTKKTCRSANIVPQRRSHRGSRKCFGQENVIHPILSSHESRAGRLLGLPWVLNTIIMGDHEKIDRILLVKIGKYTGFCVYHTRMSYFLWSPVIVATSQVYTTGEHGNQNQIRPENTRGYLFFGPSRRF